MTHEEISYLWRLHALKLWNKIAFEIAFYPHRKLRSHIRVLKKYATMPITTNEIGPGSEFLSWFQALRPKEQANDHVELTKKQRSFVFALSHKLGTSPSVVFAMLQTLRMVDAWFTVAKVLADRPFEKLSQMFDDLSEQTFFMVSSNDLLNSKTMLDWLKKSLEFLRFAQLNNSTNWSISSNYYNICRSITRCWKCKEMTPVYAIAVPVGSFTLREVKDDIFIWIPERHPGILTYVTEFSIDSSQSGDFSVDASFYKDFSKSAEMSYWINHCSHCGIKQGDQALREPGCAFWPLSITVAKEIKIYQCSQPIKARCQRSEFLCLDDATVVKEWSAL